MLTDFRRYRVCKLKILRHSTEITVIRNCLVGVLRVSFNLCLFAISNPSTPPLRSPQQEDGDPRTPASPAGSVLLPVSVRGLHSAAGGGGGSRGQRAAVRCWRQSTRVWIPVWQVQWISQSRCSLVFLCYIHTLLIVLHVHKFLFGNLPYYCC